MAILHLIANLLMPVIINIDGFLCWLPFTTFFKLVLSLSGDDALCMNSVFHVFIFYLQVSSDLCFLSSNFYAPPSLGLLLMCTEDVH